MPTRTSRVLTACALSGLLGAAVPVAAETTTSLAAARDLYASAAYDDALAMLDGLASATRARDERQTIDLYRALCLVALGRPADADTAIEAMVVRDPMYRAAGEDLAPRVRASFVDTRKRLLPTIIQRQYGEAKAAFDHQEFERAAQGFSMVLDEMADPDVAPQTAQPPLLDIKTLAAGFKELSVKLIPPPPAPAPVALPPPPVVLKAFYTADDRNVTAPVTIKQKLPSYAGKLAAPMMGMLEFLVNEDGTVENAVMRMSVDSVYDRQAVAAAKNWQYQPATVDGKPVKFLKRLSISLVPSQAQ
jgi:TonB family protein